VDVTFVYIGGIVDHHCLSFLFYLSSWFQWKDFKLLLTLRLLEMTTDG